MKMLEVTGQPVPTIEQYYPIAKTIVQHCKPFLSMIDGQLSDYPLFHGVGKKTPVQGLIKMACPTFRGPRDSDEVDHEIADNYFFKQFGIRYRSNAFFGTGSIFQARGYGQTCLMFPIGAFNFCYSEDYVDMTVNLESSMEDYHDNSFGDGDNDEYGDPLVFDNEEVIPMLLQQAGYMQNRDLKNAIHCGSEIMFNNGSGAYLYPIEQIRNKFPELSFIEQAIHAVLQGKQNVPV